MLLIEQLSLALRATGASSTSSPSLADAPLPVEGAVRVHGCGTTSVWLLGGPTRVWGRGFEHRRSNRHKPERGRGVGELRRAGTSKEREM